MTFAVTLASTLTACGGGGSGPPAAGPTFTSFPIANGFEPPQVFGIAVGTNNTIWFGAVRELFAEVGRLTAAGVVSTYTLASGEEPGALAVSNDGSLWFTQTGVNSLIGHLSSAGILSSVVLPGGVVAHAISSGPDGAIWLTLSTPAGGIAIGRLSTAGALTVFPVATTADAADGITAGPDGALWFTMYDGLVGSSNPVTGDAIGRMTTAGAVQIFPLPKGGAAPGAIVKGPDGALWFNEQTAPRLGRITTGGSIDEFSPAIAPGVYGETVGSMTAGNDGALWFIESEGLGIGRITPAGTFTTYTSPPNSAFNGIVLGPEGAFWLSDLDGEIWRFVP